MIVRLELNSSEKVILSNGDNAATYKLSDISVEYDAIFDKPYPTTIGGTMSVPYTQVKSIHYEILSKNDTTWKIDVNNLPVRSLQGLILLFFNKRDGFANKNDKIYKSSAKKILTAINGMPNNFSSVCLQAKNILP